MENNRTEILRELEAALAALKEQVRAFEDRLEAFRQLPPEAPVEEPAEESDFTDIEIGVSDIPEPAPAVEDLPEPEPVPEPVEAPAPEPEPIFEPVEAPVPGAVRPHRSPGR